MQLWMAKLLWEITIKIFKSTDELYFTHVWYLLQSALAVVAIVGMPWPIIKLSKPAYHELCN